MKKLEVEVKFYLDNITDMQRSIAQLGAESKGRFFEKNIRFEDAGHTLIKKGSLLRLRQDKRAILTFKSRPPEQSREFKIFNELEVEVSDFKTMNQILTRVGLRPVQHYEKWRETMILDQTAFYLDTMPYGSFLEIEGQEADIRHYAARLNLEWPRRIIFNYLEIFEKLRKKSELGFTDLTFKNFETVDANVYALLDELEAGEG